MPLTSTWLGREAIDRIGSIRLRCYGNRPTDLPDMIKRADNDRFEDGDVLVLADETGDVASATSLSLTMNLRGRPVPCQGVAWVGTTRSHRRRKVDGQGLASTVMRTLLAKARERGQIVSMLAPFRASFYEHFGYGLIERQLTWTIPLGILPRADTSGFREGVGDTLLDACLASRRRQFAQTHGDIETDERGLRHWLQALAGVGFRMVDVQQGEVTSQFTLGSVIENDDHVAVVHRPWWDSDAALIRLLSLLGTLKDQYGYARITLPASLPLNWLLSERQIPHRRVDHPAATCQQISRMQLRILDHSAFLANLAVPAGVAGRCTLAISESEGTTTTLSLDVSDGRIAARPATSEADLLVSDVTWAAIAMGELPVASAVALGLVDVRNAEAVACLSSLFEGLPPYCHEYF